ncbi:MAG: hypothetical protein IEMM0002_1271 [bacterium]|nr:MAG: hypothetical protein IEMM0002_1271 [bacterium]
MRVALVYILIAVTAASAWAEPIKVRNRFHNSMPTNVLGTSLSSSPHVQVIRSKRGAAHLLNRFKVINNRTTQRRLRKLKRQLRYVNFSKYMVIAVLSQPTDNYQLKIKKVSLENDVITVAVSYKHELKEYDIPPQKSIHYEMVMVKKHTQPVLLEAHSVKVKNKVKETQEVTVTGRLMPWKKEVYQLVPVKIRRGKKNSYYIRGENLEELTPYLGRVVTLKGSVSHERDGPYESDLTVQKVIRVYD